MAVTLALPVLAPKHNTEKPLAVGTTADGATILTVADLVQALASVTLTM